MGARQFTFGRLSFHSRTSGTEGPAVALSPPMRHQGTRQREVMPLSPKAWEGFELVYGPISGGDSVWQPNIGLT